MVRKGSAKNRIFVFRNNMSYYVCLRVLDDVAENIYMSLYEYCMSSVARCTSFQVKIVTVSTKMFATETVCAYIWSRYKI